MSVNMLTFAVALTAVPRLPLAESRLSSCDYLWDTSVCPSVSSVLFSVDPAFVFFLRSYTVIVAT